MSMRFAAPRSISPSPVRGNRKHRRGGAFGVPDESDSEESASDSESTASTDSFCYASESEVPAPPPRPTNIQRTETEMRQIEDAVASIRLRTRHHDVYEEWEKETRRDAFRTARQEHVQLQDQQRDEQEKVQAAKLARIMELQQRQADQVAAQLRAMHAQRAAEDERLRLAWQARDRQLWDRIEGVIKIEEEKVRRRLEEERARLEEADRRRREELARRAAEEKKKAEEEERKRQEEEEKRKEEEARELERKKLEDEEKARAEQAKNEAKERQALGMTTAEADWKAGRETLKRLKEGPMKTVKGNREMKSVWSALRRQITPKIGQITNDEPTINRIAQQITGLLRPTPPLHDDIYAAGLSALAKAILLQAETEVTAEKKAAIPLASVTARLLFTLPSFGDVLYAKAIQRVGGWLVPCPVPMTDLDGTRFDEATRRKVAGYREGESSAEYSARVTGIARVYFEVLKASVAAPDPLPPMWRLPRVWIWMARMLSTPRLLEVPVAPQLIYAALDVVGVDARTIWGAQWTKMLALLYEGVTVGLGNAGLQAQVGGEAPEGKAARVRVQLEIERIMGRA